MTCAKVDNIFDMGNDSKKNVAEMIKFYIYPPPKKVVEGEEIHIQVLVCTQSECEVFCVRARLNFEEFANIVG